MAKLTKAARARIPAKDFAGPGRTFPIEDRAHAKAAILDAPPRLKARIEAAVHAKYGRTR